MLGSWDDAEDAVQETYLRGFRAWAGFEGLASVRTWLYRIATNVCLNASRDRTRRALPSGIGAPTGDGDSEALGPEHWIQPFAGDRDDLRLALIAGMQILPGTQRAVLILREVLGFSAAEVAEMLEISIPAVKSRLQRARTTLELASPVAEDVVEPTAPEARRLLDTYVRAFEAADVDVLTAVLRADATLELVPDRSWYAGKDACSRILADAVGRAGDWRMHRTIANGQPAVVAHLRGRPFGIAVLDVRRDGIAAITVFGDPALVERFTDRRGTKGGAPDDHDGHRVGRLAEDPGTDPRGTGGGRRRRRVLSMRGSGPSAEQERRGAISCCKASRAEQ